MASSGPRYPSAAANVGVGATWTDPTNVFSEDDVAATATLIEPRAMFTTTLFASGFGFSISSEATIDGIQVQIRRKSSAGIGGGVFTSTMELTDTTTGNLGGAEWVTNYAYETFGSATDLWGRSWTPDDINDSGFGVSIAAGLSPLGASSADLSLDVIAVTVWYTQPPTVTCGPKKSTFSESAWDGVTSGSAEQSFSSAAWNGVTSGADTTTLSGGEVSGDGVAEAIFATADWSGVIYDEMAVFAGSVWDSVVAADESDFTDVAWDGVCH